MNLLEFYPLAIKALGKSVGFLFFFFPYVSQLTCFSCVQAWCRVDYSPITEWSIQCLVSDGFSQGSWWEQALPAPGHAPRHSASDWSAPLPASCSTCWSPFSWFSAEPHNLSPCGLFLSSYLSLNSSCLRLPVNFWVPIPALSWELCEMWAVSRASCPTVCIVCISQEPLPHFLSPGSRHPCCRTFVCELLFCVFADVRQEVRSAPRCSVMAGDEGFSTVTFSLKKLGFNWSNHPIKFCLGWANLGWLYTYRNTFTLCKYTKYPN